MPFPLQVCWCYVLMECLTAHFLGILPGLGSLQLHSNCSADCGLCESSRPHWPLALWLPCLCNALSLQPEDSGAIKLWMWHHQKREMTFFSGKAVTSNSIL